MIETKFLGYYVDEFGNVYSNAQLRYSLGKKYNLSNSYVYDLCDGKFRKDLYDFVFTSND